MARKRSRTRDRDGFSTRHCRSNRNVGHRIETGWVPALSIVGVCYRDMGPVEARMCPVVHALSYVFNHLSACFVSSPAAGTVPCIKPLSLLDFSPLGDPAGARAVFERQSAEFNMRPLLSPFVLDHRSRRSEPACVHGIHSVPGRRPCYSGPAGHVACNVRPVHPSSPCVVP